jgi:hypothetical protein
VRERHQAVIDVTWDAPHENPVTMPKRLDPSAELNSSSRRTLNSKQGKAFRSTSIERNPLSRRERRPHQGERRGGELREVAPDDAERVLTQVDRDVRVDEIVQRFAQIGGALRQLEKLSRE